MAKLKVRNFKEDVFVPEEMGKRIIDLRKDGDKEPEYYTIGPLQIAAKDIRTVILDSVMMPNDPTDKLRVDLDNPEEREKVKDFEKELGDFYETVEPKYRSFEAFAWKERAIVCKEPYMAKRSGKIRWLNFWVYNVPLYDKLFKLFSALSELKVRRAYAEKKEKESFEEVYDKKVSEFAQKLAPHFDSNEINPSEIPF